MSPLYFLSLRSMWYAAYKCFCFDLDLANESFSEAGRVSDLNLANGTQYLTQHSQISI